MSKFKMIFAIVFLKVEFGQAQYHVPVYTGTPLMIAAGVVTQQTLNNQLSVTNPQPSESDLTVVAESSNVPSQMAKHYPAHIQKDAEKLFTTLLEKFPEFAKSVNCPSSNLATAVATFIAGSLAVSQGVEVSTSQFSGLYQQVHFALSQSPELAKASRHNLRALYEQTAIHGLFMALAAVELNQNPNTAKLNSKNPPVITFGSF